MARGTMDLRFRLLKESNRSKFDSYSVRNGVLIISHITFRDNCVFENSWPLCPSQKSWEQRKRYCDCLALTVLTRLGPLAEPTFCI